MFAGLGKVSDAAVAMAQVEECALRGLAGL